MGDRLSRLNALADRVLEEMEQIIYNGGELSDNLYQIKALLTVIDGLKDVADILRRISNLDQTVSSQNVSVTFAEGMESFTD